MKRKYLFYVVCLSLMIVTPVVVLLLYPPIPRDEEDYLYLGFSIIFFIEALLLIIVLSFKYRNKTKKVASTILMFLLFLSILAFSYTVKGEISRLVKVEATMHDDIIDVVGVADDEINTIIYPIPGVGVNQCDILREYIEGAFDKLEMVFEPRYCLFQEKMCVKN